MDDDPEMLTVREAAEVAGVSLNTLYSWIYRGRREVRLKAERHGSRWYVDHDVLVQFVQRTSRP